MTTKLVKPEPGIVVLDPVSLQHVPEDGAIVPWNSYWQRRVREGGLIIVEPDKPTPRKARKSKIESTEDTEQ
jgi:hypothetical protein